MNPQSVRRLKTIEESLAEGIKVTVSSPGKPDTVTVMKSKPRNRPTTPTGWELGGVDPFIPFVDENTWIAFTTEQKASLRRVHFVKANSSSQVRRALTYHGHDPKEYTIRALNAEYIHELIDLHVTRKHRSTRSR